MTPNDARHLMEEWTQQPALRTHMECVACCMRAHARHLDPPEADRWEVAGLLHDFDYERHPSPEEHPTVGVAHLRERGDVDSEILDAILGHAHYTGTPRVTPMQRALFAVDELAGFIVACCKVRPNGIADLEAASVKKKLRDKSFAAAVSRDDIAKGAEGIGVELTDLIQTCIDALRADARRLGLLPNA